MSYVFTQNWRRDKLSGLGFYQLQRPGHISQVWRRDKLAGLGTLAFIGPDQPWTAATASKWITERTRQCDAGHRIIIKTTPPTYYGAGPDGYSKKLPVAGCYATGRVKETAKAGSQRVQEWCCPPLEEPTYPVTKLVTQEQAAQYATLCEGQTISLPSGGSILTILGWWLHKSHGIPSAMCRASGVVDGDYKLLCCRDKAESNAEAFFVDKNGKVWAKKPVAGAVAAPTASQIEAQTSQQAAQAARTEAVLVASQEPEYGLWERYKWLVIIGGGAIGLGLLAGIVGKKLNRRGEPS
jgi:hypothetical protein